jgi:predicted dehydrogenase
MKNTSHSLSGSLSRRDFCRTVAVAGAVLSMPMIVPSRLFGANAPSKRLRVGQLGCGRIALGHDMPGVLRSGLADIVAVCDLDSKRTANGQTWAENHYRGLGAAVPDVAAYGDYRELLAHPDLDAVIISTPDHQHAEPAMAAARAKKHIYLQKPFTMTLAEGILLRDTVEKTGCILQVGSQQRSTSQFRRACELVRSGRIGRVRYVEIGLPIDPTKPDDPAQPVPPNLDYDRWLGPTPQVYYTEQRVHPQHDYSRPGWLRNESYCLGMITGWGSHHYDTLHWALDTELTGPTKVEGYAEFPRNSIWNVHGSYNVELTYPGDIRVSVSDKLPNGLKFVGDDGWIFVSREGQATSSDPATSSGGLKPLDASHPRLLDEKGITVELPRSDSHHRNWLECVQTNRTPLAPAAVAHRSNSACIVSWIAMKLGRPLRWDAKAEQFVNDAEANAMLSRPERPGHGVGSLPKG